jgi:DNA-binding transcriptional MerR regulator
MARQRDDDGYSLNDLTRLTEVTPRTVRYYVSEGLLPPPLAAGRRSSYSQDHLNRLRLIGLLKEAYLPLKEIRRRLQELDADQVERAIEDVLREPETDGDTRLSRHHALDLAATDDDLSDLLPASVSEAPLEPQTWPFVAQNHIPEREPVPPESPWRLPRPIKSARHEVHPSAIWRKLPIGDSAEFLIEERLYQRRREQVDALIVWAQRILENG